MKTTDYRYLTGPARNTARLELIARGDTIYGGARALVLSKAADRLGVTFAEADSAHEIVSDVYSRSTGRPSERFAAFECPECGSVHIGTEAAYKCCSLEDFE